MIKIKKKKKNYFYCNPTQQIGEAKTKSTCVGYYPLN